MENKHSFCLGSIVGVVNLVVDPAFWSHDTEMSIIKAIIIAFLSGIAGVLGKLLTSYIIDKIKNRK